MTQPRVSCNWVTHSEVPEMEWFRQRFLQWTHSGRGSCSGVTLPEVPAMEQFSQRFLQWCNSARGYFSGIIQTEVLAIQAKKPYEKSDTFADPSSSHKPALLATAATDCLSTCLLKQFVLTNISWECTFVSIRRLSKWDNSLTRKRDKTFRCDRCASLVYWMEK